jgi:hypothetical protein
MAAAPGRVLPPEPEPAAAADPAAAVGPRTIDDIDSVIDSEPAGRAHPRGAHTEALHAIEAGAVSWPRLGRGHVSLWTNLDTQALQTC